MTTYKWLQWSVAAAALSMVMGCGGSGSSSPTAPEQLTQATAVSVLTAMEQTLQDEYHAEAIYQGVLDDHGNVMPFFNIIRAEQRHSAAIAQLFERRNLPVPPSEWSVANVPHFATVPLACAAAVDAELENIELYDVLMAPDLPTDVEQVFTSNRAASLNRHLPAFELCR